MSSDQEQISDHSGEESDSSIGTEELNDIQNSLNESFKEEDAPVKISKPKQKIPEKKKGRPPKPLEEKLAKQVIKKEKIVYIIQDSEGNVVRKDPTKLTMKELRKLKIEDEAQKTEIEYGKKLARLKSGKAKIPKSRTEAQMKATEKMLEANRLRRAGKKNEAKSEIKEVVKQSVKEVVQEPAIQKPPPPQKSIEQQYNDFFG